MAGVRMPELPPATAGVGRGQLLRDRDQESPSCTQHLLPHHLEAAVGGVVAKGKVWEGSERDHWSSPVGTMQDPGSPELLLCQSPAASKEPFACPGASALRFHAKHLETAPVLKGQLSGWGTRWCFEAWPARGLPNNPKPAEPRLSPGLKNKALL